RAEGDDRREQFGRRDPVCERTAGPVADRQSAEEDADEGAPDEERVAEERREESAGSQFRAQERRARREDGDGDHLPAQTHLGPCPGASEEPAGLGATSTSRPYL